MQSIAIALPVKSGKESEAREFAKTALGPKRRQLEEAAKKLGIHHEEWFLQQGEMGPLLVGFMEADNVEKVFENIRAEKDGFVGWYKDRVQSITGVDLNQGPPNNPEQLVAFRA